MITNRRLLILYKLKLVVVAVTDLSVDLPEHVWQCLFQKDSSSAYRLNLERLSFEEEEEEEEVLQQQLSISL